MNRPLLVAVTVTGVVVVGAALLIGVGAYNVAADQPHSSLVYRLLETARERSIAVRAATVEVPSLDNPENVRRGAGNYDAMCKSCHLAPGMKESELSVGLYPVPPDLSTHAHTDPAEVFWVIKHGIKASGMAAWGKRMEDSYIWDLVAFLRKLPTLSSEQYASEVAASGGHSHGGGESSDDDHADGAGHEKEPAEQHSHDDGKGSGGENGHQHADTQQTTTAEPQTHADDKQHAHAAPEGTPMAAAQALHEALSSGNAKKVEDLLDPNVLILEGGNAERSRKEYAAHHLSSDLKFMKSVQYRLERQSGDTVGELAWVASEARLTGSPEGKSVDVVSKETLVLKKASTGWRIVHVHWSSRSGKKQ